MRSIFNFFVLVILSVCLFTANDISAQTDGDGARDLLAEFNSADKSQKMEWAGEWSVSARHSPQDLVIKVEGTDKFKFEIDSLNGANMGNISGTAKIKGDKAYFDDREAGGGEDAEFNSGCRLLFTHKIKLIEVDASRECMSYAGMGVYFDGEYSKGKPPKKEGNFVQLEVFPNAEMDKKFRSLVGQDYEKFLDAFHLISEEEDLDNLNAKVFEACVRGVCTYFAGIIMYDPKGNIYAMVIDMNDAEQTTARYYTNNEKYYRKFPKTIEKWLVNKGDVGGDLTVIFKRKN